MSRLNRKLRIAARRVRRLGRGEGTGSAGVAIMEFALVLPVLITLGFYGTEVAYMATINMQISQMATSAADNASRLGQTDNSAVAPTVTAAQVDSVMTGALLQGSSFSFSTRGRIIISSLERDVSTNREYIHWQRCRGSLARTSYYGAQGYGLTGATLDGMGATNHKIHAPAIVSGATTGAVMYVEVFYSYNPLFGNVFVRPTEFHREAALLVRDDRNMTVIPGNGSSACT